MTITATVLLTLVGLGTFRRRDLKDPATGITAEIKKGDTIRVTEAIADELTNDEYGTKKVDEDQNVDHSPFFVVAEDGTKVTFDFTKSAAASVETSITHDLTDVESDVPKTQAAQTNTRNQRARKTT